ncbi:MAG: methyltransferase domain-containing protein [Pseudonocardiaceae bacterium]
MTFTWPGHRVLEIGAGTGYNAALLAHLVGPAGKVTTVDIDSKVVRGARECLAAAGYRGVSVVCGDGEFGYSDHAPYDRIVVTAGAWDLPPAWVDQLAAGGRLVVPLRFPVKSAC